MIDKVAGLRRDARSRLIRGDALQRQGKENEAGAEFRMGVELLDRALQVLRDASSLTEEQRALAQEFVDVYGARGGFLRRLGEAQAALESYALGADLERRFMLQCTYNRANEIKYGLLSGLRSLAKLEPEIDALAKELRVGLDGDRRYDCWAWAELGDLCVLLGDGEGAERAYRSFIEKAKPTVPRTTLDVLGSILQELERSNDERSAAVRRSLEYVRGRLNLR